MFWLCIQGKIVLNRGEERDKLRGHPGGFRMDVVKFLKSYGGTMGFDVL